MQRPQLSFFCPQKHAQAHVTATLSGAARRGLAGGAGGDGAARLSAEV